MENGQVVIRKRGADRIRRGTFGFIGAMLFDTKMPRRAALFRFETSAVMCWARLSTVQSLRSLFDSCARRRIVIDEDFFRQRFDVADRFASSLGVDPLLSRRIYSEGDLLPGLIVDRYDDRLVVQSLIQATDAIQPFFIDIIQRSLSTSLHSLPE